MNKYRHLQFFIVLIFLSIAFFACTNHQRNEPLMNEKKTPAVYNAPDTTELEDDIYGLTVKYGARLIYNTAYYLGPDGVVGKYLGNKMNCGNCHLEGGRKPYGNNFFLTHQIYPQYRARENKVMTTADRVNNCIERPHNGQPIPLDSYEMVAITSYIQWIGKNYDEEKHIGHGLKEFEHKGLKSDPVRGQKVYETHCKSCHQANGEGLLWPDGKTYQYPPLWGNQSYQKGSSMHRVLKSASFIYHNMPHPMQWDKPVLSIQEALDVAGFINDNAQHPRPEIKGPAYPNIATKPKDFYLGPYQDGKSETEHTFGPWDSSR